MDRDSDRCALELSDAAVDVMGYACLVAIMSMGLGYHRESQSRLHQVTIDNYHPCPVVSSAGALVEGLTVLGAKKIALITPYRKPLTDLVCQYLESEGFEVINLDLRETLVQAMTLYENLGYKRIGEHPYYAKVDGQVLKGYYYTKSI